jgi:hypothetical protein
LHFTAGGGQSELLLQKMVHKMGPPEPNSQHSPGIGHVTPGELHGPRYCPGAGPSAFGDASLTEDASRIGEASGAPGLCVTGTLEPPHAPLRNVPAHVNTKMSLIMTPLFRKLVEGIFRRR